MDVISIKLNKDIKLNKENNIGNLQEDGCRNEPVSHLTNTQHANKLPNDLQKNDITDNE